MAFILGDDQVPKCLKHVSELTNTQFNFNVMDSASVASTNDSRLRYKISIQLTGNRTMILEKYRSSSWVKSHELRVILNGCKVIMLFHIVMLRPDVE